MMGRILKPLGMAKRELQRAFLSRRMKKLLRYKYNLQINIFFQAPDFELSEMCKHIKAVDVDLQSVFLKRLFVLIFLKLC